MTRLFIPRVKSPQRELLFLWNFSFMELSFPVSESSKNISSVKFRTRGTFDPQ